MFKKITVAALMLLISTSIFASESFDYLSQLPEDSVVKQRCNACKDFWSIAGLLGRVTGRKKHVIISTTIFCLDSKKQYG